MLVAVLAGGQSRRMGRDKAVLDFDGVTMIERVLRAASDAGLPAAIIGGNPARFLASLGKKFPRIPIMPDDTPGAGPVAGLVTALHWFPYNDAVMLLPCDAPLITAADILWLCEVAVNALDQDAMEVPAPDRPDAVIPVHNGRPEPLFAVYTQSVFGSAKRLLDASLHSNEKASFKRLLEDLRCHHIPLPADRRGAISDIDTPEQLHELRGQAPTG